ncbi:MAG: contractile injection system protein, VgrG/Pvc8 family [Polyangiaceae bacterium]
MSESLGSSRLTVDGRAVPILALRGKEALSRPYRFDLQLSEAADLEPSLVVGKACSLVVSTALGDSGISERLFRGLVSRARVSRGLVTLSLSPHWVRLELDRQHRVFEGISPEDIVARVLGERAIPHRFERLGAPGAPVVAEQRGDSTLRFIERVLAIRGLEFRFEAEGESELVVFSAEPPPLASEALVEYGRPRERSVVRLADLDRSAREAAWTPLSPTRVGDCVRGRTQSGELKFATVNRLDYVADASGCRVRATGVFDDAARALRVTSRVRRGFVEWQLGGRVLRSANPSRDELDRAVGELGRALESPARPTALSLKTRALSERAAATRAALAWLVERLPAGPHSDGRALETRLSRTEAKFLEIERAHAALLRTLEDIGARGRADQEQITVARGALSRVLSKAVEAIQQIAREVRLTADLPRDVADAGALARERLRRIGQGVCRIGVWAVEAGPLVDRLGGPDAPKLEFASEAGSPHAFEREPRSRIDALGVLDVQAVEVLRLRVGESVIELTKDRITLSSPVVRVLDRER